MKNPGYVIQVDEETDIKL